MKNSKTLLALELVLSGLFLWLVKVSHFDAGIYMVETFSQFVLFLFSVSGAVGFGQFFAIWIYVIVDNIISYVKK